MTTFILIMAVVFILFLLLKALKCDVYADYTIKKNAPILVLLAEMLFIFWLLFLLVAKNPATNTFFYVAIGLLAISFLIKKLGSLSTIPKVIFAECVIGIISLSFASIRTMV